MLAGLDEPTGGEIAFMGKTVSSAAAGVIADPRERNAGLVFQSYALWPHMTVAGNIGWPLQGAGWDRAAREAPIGEVLALLGIAALRALYPAEIPGDQPPRAPTPRPPP